MSPPAIQSLRRMTGFMRLTAALVLIAFTLLVLLPAERATRQVPAQPAPTPVAAAGPAPNFLEALRDSARRARDPAGGQSQAAHRQRLIEAESALDAEERAAEAGFAEVERHLQEHGLPAEIMQRHQAAVAEYRARAGELRAKLRAFREAQGRGDEAGSQRALNDLAEFLDRFQKTPPHQPFDPHNLPFRTPEEQVRPPRESKEELNRIARPQPPVKVAAAALTPGMLAPAEPGATPTPEDLAETEDVQLTPALRAKALALHHNPVEIVNWVRNTVEFLPTYGSIQGADLTLQTRRGNAFDTASLLIALLRAADIPARYVYGTIQVPAEQVMNWVGGVKTPEAAQSLLGQGGIPSIGLAQGGRIVAFKLEHVWVEAYVDYVPSRGAVHRVGDTWVALDGSFKQYRYTDGMDLQAAVPLDAEDLLNQIQAGATVNAAEGWVRNLNGAALQTALTDYQERIKTYIDSQNPEATVGDVLGTKRIVEQNLPVLAGSLPYRTLASAGQTAALAADLRAKYRYTLYTGIDYNAVGGGDVQRGSEVFSYTASLPRLAGGKLTLSFVPAAQADTDLISSYLPRPHPDGTPIQPGELPGSLPGYLIHLKAEYRLDGQLVASGGDFVMGSNYIGSSSLYSPDRGWQAGADNVRTAGEYWATYAGANVSQSRMNGLKARLQATKTKLEQFQADPGNTAPVANLTKEDLTGDLLYSTLLGYFAANEASQRIEQQTAGAVAYRLPSFGHFGVSARVTYWYGIPRQVAFPGLTMDIDQWKDTAVMKDNDAQKKIAFIRQGGTRLSAYEHLVPEKFWTNEQNPGEGVSAVKALAKAAAEGQKIYTLTGQNASAIYQIQIDDAIRAEIQNALNAGKTVTVHERPITVSGWSGTGYIIADPGTGAGAYKISGGANGGILPLLSGIGLGAASAASLILVGALANIWLLAAGFVLVVAITLIVTVALYNLSVWSQTGCFWQGVGTGGSLVSALFGASQIATLLQSSYISETVRVALYNAFMAFFSTIVFGGVGAVAPSNPIQECLTL